ncbi:MAG: hypothetical protein GXY67_07745 [Clostridiales bacterium]|nr:hypothetical protein [Clostridiales bacterium]
MKTGTKKMLLGLGLFLLIVAVGLLASRPARESILATLKQQQQVQKAQTIYGAVGGGKENFLADAEVNRILLEDYQLVVINDAWSNGKLIKEPLTYEQNGVNKTYDFVFFSDQRYYEYYQTPAASGEALRLPRKKSAVALNTPIVFYSWDQVTQALMAQGIVSETDGVFYVTDMPRLLAYINEEKKWSEIGVGGLYGSVNIASTDPVTSSPGATYYGLLAAIMGDGQVSAQSLITVLPRLQDFYLKSGFMNNTPADLFDLYLRTGMGAKPLIVDYEKSMVDFANQNPEGYAQVKDRVRILYPAPTIWNSHCIIAFSDAGVRFVEALSDKRIQEIAFSRYGFRTGVTGGQYDVSAVGVTGIPQELVSVVPGLTMDTYERIVSALKEAGE